MASSPPYFAFYPADFSGDELVEAMTTIQVGAYILLLCKAWLHKPPASLPNDDAILARYARLEPHVWSEVKAGVLAPFTLGTDGRLHQKRLRKEYETAVAKCKKAAENGRLGGQARSVRLANAKRMLSEGSSDAQAGSLVLNSESSSSEGNGGGSGEAGEAPPGFLRFWSAYPRKVKREAALAAWLLVAPDAALEARILAAVEVQKHTAQWRDRGAIPNADNWLVDGRWTDEVSEGSFTTGKDYAAIERQKAAQREREQAVLSQQAPTIEALRPEIRKLAGPRNRGTDARK